MWVFGYWVCRKYNVLIFATDGVFDCSLWNSYTDVGVIWLIACWAKMVERFKTQQMWGFFFSLMYKPVVLYFPKKKLWLAEIGLSFLKKRKWLDVWVYGEAHQITLHIEYQFVFVFFTRNTGYSLRLFPLMSQVIGSTYKVILTSCGFPTDEFLNDVCDIHQYSLVLLRCQESLYSERQTSTALLCPLTFVSGTYFNIY